MTHLYHIAYAHAGGFGNATIRSDDGFTSGFVAEAERVILLANPALTGVVILNIIPLTPPEGAGP